MLAPVPHAVLSLKSYNSPEEIYELLKVNFLKASLGSVPHNPVRFGAGTEEEIELLMKALKMIPTQIFRRHFRLFTMPSSTFLVKFTVFFLP